MTIETEAQIRARHAKELRDLRAEQKRIEQRDDRDEKHLAKWLRKRHYAHFRELADMRDAELAARRERTRARVEKHRAEPDVTPVETGGVTPVEARDSWDRDEPSGAHYA